jgi:hypothetical protein
MATPTTLPAAAVAGDVLTAAYVNNLRGAFRILQVVNATFATVAASISATYADTGLTATITPSATSSKILMMVSTTSFTDTANTGLGLRLVRGATTLVTNIGYSQSSGGSVAGDPNFSYLDSPNTTSATTYKLQFARNTGAGIAYVMPYSNQAYITLMEISA